MYRRILLIVFTIFSADNAGKQVVYGELLEYTIDLSILPIGVYTLKIDGEKTMKIVKY